LTKLGILQPRDRIRPAFYLLAIRHLMV
jgi:hypothetical protein